MPLKTPAIARAEFLDSTGRPNRATNGPGEELKQLVNPLDNT